MADYAGESFSLSFTYIEWQQIQESLKKRREDMHYRADSLEVDQPSEVTQIQGLRRKASALFDLIESIGEGLTTARKHNAAVRAGQ